MNKNANQNEYMNLTEEHQLSENAAMHFKPLKEPNRILHFLGLILKVFFYTICGSSLESVGGKNRRSKGIKGFAGFTWSL